MTKEVLTATVVGAGSGGTLSIDALLASDRYRLIGVTDLSEAARARISEKTAGTVPTFSTYEEMLEKAPSDVVCVSTYAPTHLPITKAAVEAGHVKGMLVEKPLGDTTTAGREIVELLKSHNLPMVVPHGLMAQAAALQIVERVQSGDIGPLRVVEMECTNWDIINAGIHWLQYFGALVAPSPINYVLAAVDSSTRTFRDGMQVETEAITMARAENNVRVLLNTGDHVAMSRDDTVCLMRIVGANGYIEFGAYESYYIVVGPGSNRVRVDVEPFAVSGHQRHLEHLADQIESGNRDYGVPDTSLQALEVVDAAYQSARLGKAVILPIGGEQPADGDNWDPGRPYSGVGGGRNGREL